MPDDIVVTGTVSTTASIQPISDLGTDITADDNKDITVTGKESYFNEDARFLKDVYVYGTLYYDFQAKFLQDVYIENSLNVGILTVRKRLDVGIGGTVLRAIADLQGLPFTSGKVGIGSTSPKQTLDVSGIAIVSEKVGIGGIVLPKQTLDVIGTAIVSQKIGIGGTTSPQQALDVSGSVKIDADIFDSVNSPGKNGYKLSRDIRGIRWIAMFANGAVEGVGFGTIVFPNSAQAPSTINIGTAARISTTITTVATTAATTINSFATATFRSARIQVQITQSTNYQESDILIIHDGTTAAIVEYGSIATNEYLGTFSASISGGNCLLIITMNSATSATVKVLLQSITV